MLSHKIDLDTELRILEKHHAQELFDLVDSNRNYLRQWLPWVDATKSVSQIEKFIETTQQQFGNNKGIQTAIWYKSRIVGVIGFHPIDWANYKASLGYWVAEKFQGKGLITNACRTYIDYAFNNLKLNRLEIRCGTENKKSRAIPERLKFEFEGICKDAEYLNGTFNNHAVYALLSRNWKPV